MIGDARRAPLMQGDELSKPLARLVHLAAIDEAANLDRQTRVVGERRGRRRTPCARSGSRPAVASLRLRVARGR